MRAKIQSIDWLVYLRNGYSPYDTSSTNDWLTSTKTYGPLIRIHFHARYIGKTVLQFLMPAFQITISLLHTSNLAYLPKKSNHKFRDHSDQRIDELEKLSIDIILLPDHFNARWE